MKLSIALVTFNHGSFIEQAIDSVLSQELDCDWELVIGDDASTDGTGEILSAYLENYPGHIRVLSRSENGGDYGRSNYLETLAACRGEYIAYIDGDDYWLDDTKLSQQMALLDAQPELSACAHAVMRRYEDGSSDVFNSLPGQVPLSLETVARNFSFIHCSSFMYRRSALPVIPQWFADDRVRLDDWTLTLLCAQQGHIGYINRVMSVYRKHGDGIWSGQQVHRRLLWDLDSRDFVYDKTAGVGNAIERLADQFPVSMDRAARAIDAGSLLAAKWWLWVALLEFPWRKSLSARYYLTFMVEVWVPSAKPVLLRLRDLFKR